MNDEIFEKTENIMRLRRIKAQDENERRIREINQRIPEIKEINNALFNSSREVIRAIAYGHGKDITAEIAKIKQQNMEMQNIVNQLLLSHGYPVDYLNIHYTCPKCNDTGYNDTVFCDCMKQLFVKLGAEQFRCNTNLELSHFEDFDLKYYKDDDCRTMEKILAFTRQYAENFSYGAANIMMSGSAGLGKTHLSLAIADRVIQRGFAVVYDSVINILNNIESERYKEKETLRAVLGTDLLILDDLGTEPNSEFFKSTVFNIIDTRINRSKSTIISTNLKLGDIGKKYGERVVSRLVGNYEQICFSGSDVRLQIRLEQLGSRK